MKNPSYRFLDFPDLVRDYGHPWCRSYTMRMVREGRFKAPYKLSDRVSRWRSDEVEAFYARLPRGIADQRGQPKYGLGLRRLTKPKPSPEPKPRANGAKEA